MKHIRLLILAFTVFSSHSFIAVADDGHMAMPANGHTSAQEYAGHGIINNVDVRSGRINITHDPITALGWDSMTMDFIVKDKTMLTSLQKGQKVTFKLVEARKGEYVISSITPAN